MRQGHDFKIDLEYDVPLAHRPLYKMSPLELEEAEKQIESMLVSDLAEGPQKTSVEVQDYEEEANKENLMNDKGSCVV